MSKSTESRQPLGVVVGLIAIFAGFAMSMSVIFDWKIALTTLASCPVGVVILWLSRDTQDPAARIAATDAARTEQRAVSRESSHSASAVASPAASLASLASSGV